MSNDDFVLNAIADFVVSRIPNNRSAHDNLLAIGTRVGSTMPARATGVITGYNQSTGPFYDNDRYPYVIRWEDDYEDCYGIDGEQIWVLNG